jgi:hypothetical protein
MQTQIDFYGDKANYIHLKFGDARKYYYFTGEFTKEYPEFTREYSRYFERQPSQFTNPFSIVAYVYKHNLPVHFYYNFTDTPAIDEQEIMAYLLREQSSTPNLTNKYD